MFRDRDLALRWAAAALPARAGYALTKRLTAALGGERHRQVADAVRAAAAPLLGDRVQAQRAALGFAASIACDDLDAVTAWAWPRALRRSALTVEGVEHLPASGPLVLLSFHLSGGFRVFDVARERGLDPTFLAGPPERMRGRYLRTLAHLRLSYLRRSLRVPFVIAGPGARDALAAHLGTGGSVVALLDVAPALLGLHDHARGTLLGREVDLPVGILRLAASCGAPVVPYEGRIEDGRRVLRFHPSVARDSVEATLATALAVFEQIIRARPWDWQAWLELDVLLRSESPARAQSGTSWP